jgi:hypothetical protein
MFDVQIAVALLRGLPFGYGRGQWDGDHREGWAALDSRFDREVRGHAAGADRYWSACRRALGPSEERTPGRWIY